MSSLNLKISFCVVSMNRLHQLKQTLLLNIADNAEYDNLEFVVLDYNSEDGMEEWVKENLGEYIRNDRVIYYKTTEPKSWNPSHSKNLAFKLATGDILCSIWADYYTGKGFAQYVNDIFKTNNSIVLTPIDFYKTKKNYNPPGDVLGKVCVRKTDFMYVQGFDERMNKHGFEDYDFINRLEMVGVKRILIEDFSFLKYIAHNDTERYKIYADELEGLYVNYQTASASDVLILYNDNRFERATIIDNSTFSAADYQYAYMLRNNRFEYGLKELKWENGKWEKRNGGLCFFTGCQNDFLLKEEKTENKSQMTDMANQTIFYKISNKEVINSVLVFNHFYYTRRIMEINLKNKEAIVNAQFGKATVYKNFSKTMIII